VDFQESFNFITEQKMKAPHFIEIRL